MLTRVKLGFPTPIRVWLRAEMYDWAAAILRDSPADELVDLTHGLRLLERHRRGHGDHSRKIWTLLVFCLWYETFVTGDRLPPHQAELV
jgi:asparagine synthase (glutamine-hydrolysing)